MKISIKLGYPAIAGIANDAPFVIAKDDKDDECILQFTSDSYVFRAPYHCLFVCLRNGSRTKNVKTQSGEVRFNELAYAGLLEIEVSLVIRGQVVKRWNVYPIVLKELDEDLTASDAFKDLLERVCLLEEKTKVIV